MYVEEPEILLLPLNKRERQRLRKIFDTVTYVQWDHFASIARSFLYCCCLVNNANILIRFPCRRRIRKAQTLMPPPEAFSKLADAPREYVNDAVLKYSFDEWHSVRSHYTDEHPGGHRCSLRVHVPDLGLTKEQEERLVSIAGTRYNRQSKDLKLVSRKYLDKVQNRIHVRLLLDRLLAFSGAFDSVQQSS